MKTKNQTKQSQLFLTQKLSKNIKYLAYNKSIEFMEHYMQHGDTLDDITRATKFFIPWLA